jgi:hypothetical protein
VKFVAFSTVQAVARQPIAMNAWLLCVFLAPPTTSRFVTAKSVDVTTVASKILAQDVVRRSSAVAIFKTAACTIPRFALIATLGC